MVPRQPSAVQLRQRAHSSVTDLAMIGVGSEVGGRVSFDKLVRSLVDDKYNREYKLERKTRAKAIEILKDYYDKHQDETTQVSGPA